MSINPTKSFSFGRHHRGRFRIGPSDCRKTPYGLFRQVFAGCCAHNLRACGTQILHAAAWEVFSVRYTPRQKMIWFYLAAYAAKLCEAFWASCLDCPDPRAADFSNHSTNVLWFLVQKQLCIRIFLWKRQKSLCNVLCYASFDCGFSLWFSNFLKIVGKSYSFYLIS